MAPGERLGGAAPTRCRAPASSPPRPARLQALDLGAQPLDCQPVPRRGAARLLARRGELRLERLNRRALLLGRQLGLGAGGGGVWGLGWVRVDLGAPQPPLGVRTPCPLPKRTPPGPP
jgi:hypothetical protein